MNTRKLNCLPVVLAVAGLTPFVGCDGLPGGGGKLPPITDVMQIEDGVFVGADLPQPGGSGAPPTIDELNVLAREDQAFRLEVDRDTGAAQLGVGLDGYSGHFLIAEDDCGDLERNFTMAVTSGEFTLRAVLITEDGSVGDVATGDFEVVIRGFTTSQRFAVDAGLNGVQAYLTGLGFGSQAGQFQEQMVDEDLTEIVVEGCPRFTAQRDGDETTFLWDWGEGCVQQGVVFVSGTVTGAGSIPDQSVALALDYIYSECLPVAGTAQTRNIGDESEPIPEISVDITLWTNHATLGGTWGVSGPPEGPDITLTSVTGTVTRPDDGVEASVQYENLLFLFEHTAALNFTPSSGTITLTITSAEDTGSVILVTYTEESPEDDVVLLSLNGGPAIEWVLD